MATYKCSVCQKEFEAPDGQTPTCPACGATGTDLKKIK